MECTAVFSFELNKQDCGRRQAIAKDNRAGRGFRVMPSQTYVSAPVLARRRSGGPGLPRFAIRAVFRWPAQDSCSGRISARHSLEVAARCHAAHIRRIGLRGESAGLLSVMFAQPPAERGEQGIRGHNQSNRPGRSGEAPPESTGGLRDYAIASARVAWLSHARCGVRIRRSCRGGQAPCNTCRC